MKWRFVAAGAIACGCAHLVRIEGIATQGDDVIVVAQRTVMTPFGSVSGQTVNACELDRDSDRLVCRQIGVAFDEQLPKLGISYQDRDDGGAGAAVTLVREGGPASTAGVQVGDVITACNGASVANREALAKALAAAGKNVTLAVTRADSAITVRITRTLSRQSGASVAASP